MTNLSDHVRLAIENTLQDAHRDGPVFDAYAAAVTICEAFPDAEITIDHLVDYMIAHLGSVLAVEISPPGLLIDILFPLDDEEENLRARQTPQATGCKATKSEAGSIR